MNNANRTLKLYKKNVLSYTGYGKNNGNNSYEYMNLKCFHYFSTYVCMYVYIKGKYNINVQFYLIFF